ncbi:hypothetical protein PG994_008827 [Apiospora phragmitis]|uniref:DUF7918 domain-containing protein n=1 Tax=Apiospora phragmitis TaxID=2905665 RepID=A0ABR1UHK0_9PEZI
MPIFRGIDVSIIASAEAKKLPEYPHPDSASVLLTDGDDPTRQRKVKPRISVYIPSMAGEQFWLEYSVLRMPSLASHLYFKMFMNGRPITSWGILTKPDKDGNPERPIRGTVVRALYEPGRPSQDRDLASGAQEVGIETRYFYFMAGLDKRSAAEDGGLIEVQVFRSKGRKRRAPKLTEFRDQDRYGIMSPSGGLVENPQEATFYDWLLVDPKDSPFATFCFHYRSMKHLIQLSLIPRSESQRSLPRIDSGVSVTEPPQEKSPANSPNLDDDDPRKSGFTFGVEPLHISKFDGPARVPSENRQGDAMPSQYYLRNAPQMLSIMDSSLPTPQPSMDTQDSLLTEVCHRPLPEPPRVASRHSSYSSLKSNCPSLTPSLAQYVDDGEFGDDEIAVGMARTVVSSAPSMVMLATKGTKGGESGSVSDYEHSPPSSTASDSPGHPEPGAYLTTTGSVLERHIAQLSSPLTTVATMRPGHRRIPISASEEAILRHPTPTDHDSLGLADSKWIKRTPSPVPRRSIGRFWSPRLHKMSTKQEHGRRNERKRHSDTDHRFSRELKAWTFDETPIVWDAAGSLDGTSSRRGGIVIPNHAFHGGNVRNIENDVYPMTEHFDKRNTWEPCKEPPTGNWI